jgi:hypothetical protein
MSELQAYCKEESEGGDGLLRARHDGRRICGLICLLCRKLF